MTPIDFGVKRLKVKVTGALNVRMVSTDNLENYASQSLNISHNDLS
jgi:translation elongation factor EF-1beta